ncbi:MAG: hypothetical protein LBB30_05385 [Candidatus Methanoplasma sp.]|nr:hypothetical protein [Candidatus Methanoplasma sp.]
MKKLELPECLYVRCPECDDIVEHEILKGRAGKDNVTGTFRCTECGRVFSDSIKVPEAFDVKVLFSDGGVTGTTVTELRANEILAIGDEFYLDDGRRVCITHIETEDGRKGKKFQADKIKALWVKQFDVLSVKVSVNDGHSTYSVRVNADPDDEFSTGSVLAFDDFDALVHAIKTKDRLIKNGSAEAREITRIYGKIRKKRYEVLDLEEDDDQDGFDFED